MLHHYAHNKVNYFLKLLGFENNWGRHSYFFNRQFDQIPLENKKILKKSIAILPKLSALERQLDLTYWGVITEDYDLYLVSWKKQKPEN